MKNETTDQATLTVDDQGLDIDSIRNDFPMLQTKVNGKQLIYFDTAATNHKPQVVIDKLQELYTAKYGKTEENHTFGKMMTTAFEETRSKMAEFMGANSPEEVVFTTGSTQGINIIANGFGRAILKEDDEILITMLEHHSNIVPWQLACQVSGAKLVVAPINTAGEVDLEQFEKLLSSKAKIVSITHSSNVLGTMLPVKEMVAMAHRQNIPVLVDGAQAAPHMPISMQELDCDFYVFSAHKMGGPAGVGILYGKAEWLDKLPPLLGGEGMAAEVSFEQSTYQPVPKKFEAGTPAFEEIVACGALLDYVQKLDMVKTAAYEQELMKYCTKVLESIEKVKIYGTSEEKEPVVSFVIEGKDVKELETYLNDNYNIAVRAGQLSAQPLLKDLGLDALLRISLCYFNTVEEIDILAGAIKSFINESENN
jgi:cysteine desulfurase/selenocysteine lyase